MRSIWCRRLPLADGRRQAAGGSVCHFASFLLQYDLSTAVFWVFYLSAELVPSQMCGHNFATGANTPLFPDRRRLLNPALVTSGWSWMFFQPEAQDTRDSPSPTPPKKTASHCWSAAFVLHGGQSFANNDRFMNEDQHFFFPSFLNLPWYSVIHFTGSL